MPTEALNEDSRILVAERRAAAYARIGAALHAVSRLRLDDYRESAVWRHVSVRLRARSLEHVEDYAGLLERDRLEAETLAHEILDSSTVFFRDPEAYAGLARCLPAVLAMSPSPRIWVPACAGGEDVYSVAMLVAEMLAAGERPLDFALIGTDVDAELLADARRGGFGLAAAIQVPSHLRSRYLSFSRGECRVDRALVERCSFLLHDMLMPPPVHQVHLVDCRAQLSALQLKAQRRALEHLHAALRADGLLLVARDEALAAHGDLFQRHPALAGLYQRVERRAVPRRGVTVAEPSAEAPPRPAAADASLMATGLRLMNEGMIVVDADGRITEFNRRAEQLTGWGSRHALGVDHNDVLRLIRPGGAPVASPLDACLADRNLIRRNEEHLLLTRDGRRLNVRLSFAAMVADERLLGAMLVLEDFTEQTLLNSELEFRASHDAITGLLNRSEFERRLSTAIEDASKGGGTRLLCYVDVDQFKVINDTLGHYAGDELLRQIASLFRSRLRPQDALARLGGDEFGVLLRSVGDQEGRYLVDTLLDAARSFRFQWESQSYAITVSIGVAEIRDGSDLVGTFADADAACYAAKDSGRDRARWVSDGDEDIRRRHAQMTMVGRIGQALDEGQFLLYYEDVVSATATSQVFYRELLVRMRGEDGRLVQPAGFIAAAERYYLMGALDRWVVDAAFAGIARLPADGVIYAINVSGMSLSDDQFLRYVVRSMERTGVAPERICFEITETAAISHLSEAVRFITYLAELGCRFALDDFGAGMASFSYLKNLPVQFVKIDGGFVRNMQASSVDRGMVETINRLGHEMGLRTIAEHVETPEALAALAAIGVDWVQGKALGEGRPFEDLLDSSEH